MTHSSHLLPLLLLLSSLSSGCAAGLVTRTVIYQADGKTVASTTCVVRGIALGRALLATGSSEWSYIGPGGESKGSTDISQDTTTGDCVAHGGAGSGGFWASVAAAIAVVGTVLVTVAPAIF